MHFRYAETGINTFRYVGEADTIPQPGETTDLAARLAALEVRQSFGGGLPASVAFMDFMGYRSLQQLEAEAWAIGRPAGRRPKVTGSMPGSV